MKKRDSKTFRTILNRLTGNKKDNEHIIIEGTYEHLMNLNDSYDSDGEFIYVNNISINNAHTNDILNCPIINDEIIAGIEKLKCNKASGIDKILNEYIIYTYEYFYHYIVNYLILF